jgi:hypothetical protein
MTPLDEQASPAAELVAALIDAELLEVVNRHAHRTLTEPLERALAESDDQAAATAVLTVLEDAPEVVDVYADDDQLLAAVRHVRRRR